MDDFVAVNVGTCRCPDQPHEDGDVVYLRPRLGLAAGIAVQKLVIDANQAEKPLTVAELTGVLAEGYLVYGVAAWNLRGSDGPVAVTSSTIRTELLDDFERGAPAADAADGLYMTAVIAPLLKKALSSSRGTSSNGSTSAPGNGARPPRKRSKRSSTTTTQTAATATTSG